MSTRQKRHLIAGTIIGGLLLAATTQTGNSFALSDTSSPSGTGTTTTQQAPATSTGSNTTTTSDPTTKPATGTDVTAGGSTATQTADTNAGASSGTSSTAASPASTSAPDPTSTGSGNQQPSTVQNSDPSNTALTNSTTANNKVKSTADTGDATVKHLSDGGNATTGNASAMATLINTIASSSDISGNNIPTATYNVNGTQNGDLVVNPEAILASANTGSDPTPINPLGNATADNNATINNLVNLMAQSGNAKVTDNGVGGDATSGNATTEADILNMIQDMVSNKGAFLGIVNVNGNLNGNIDIPAGDISSLLTPTSSDGTLAGDSSATNNANVNNNVTLTAISGNAMATNNGIGGSATSGNASTILNENNLLNLQVVGGNLLLVFVNVMGHWYGALLSEPAGTNTATLGGGITQDTLLPMAQTTATNNSTINNNVTLTSISGNATVANNGSGGNAATGAATAIADITNIIGSQINLSGWLGILIINVFGTWNGSLAIQPNTTTTAPVSTDNGHHNAIFAGDTHFSGPNSGYSYSIYNAPQSFNQGQFDLASANMTDNANDVSGNVLGTSIRPAAVTTNHATRPSKHLIADFVLAGIGATLALTGGISRFLRRPQK